MQAPPTDITIPASDENTDIFFFFEIFEKKGGGGCFHDEHKNIALQVFGKTACSSDLHKKKSHLR